MKKTVKKVIKESTGRDLVGASSFSSRSSVVDKILKKYPDPKALASALAELASKNKDARAKAKLMELATKCSSLSKAEYPNFVAKISGFSKLWGIVGATTAVATLTAVGMWAYSAFCRADAIEAQKVDKFNKNADEFNAESDRLNKRFMYANEKDFPVQRHISHREYNPDWKKTIKNIPGIMKSDITGAWTKGSQYADNAQKALIKKWHDLRGDTPEVVASEPPPPVADTRSGAQKVSDLMWANKGRSVVG